MPTARVRLLDSKVGGFVLPAKSDHQSSLWVIRHGNLADTLQQPTVALWQSAATHRLG